MLPGNILVLRATVQVLTNWKSQCVSYAKRNSQPRVLTLPIYLSILRLATQKHNWNAASNSCKKNAYETAKIKETINKTKPYNPNSSSAQALNHAAGSFIASILTHRKRIYSQGQLFLKRLDIRTFTYITPTYITEAHRLVT